MSPALRITPKELLDYLASTGRIVFPRTLTDWRAKGLLPPLKEAGRGRGPGKLQYWDDPAVRQQAIVLFDTLAAKRRTDSALWVLWFCGFDVDPEKVRVYWLETLDAALFKKDRDFQETISDKYAAEFGRLADLMVAKQNWDLETAEPIAREILVSANELPSIPIDKEEFGELFAAVKCLIADFNQDQPIKCRLTRKRFQRWLQLYKAYSSVAGLKQTLFRITVPELGRAQNYLITLGSLLLAFAKAAHTNPDEYQFLEIRRLFAPIFGRQLIEAILLVMNSGQEEILASAQPIICRITEAINRGEYAGPKLQLIQAEFGQLFNVLSALDWKILYNSARK